MTRDGKPWFVNGEPVMRAEIVDFWQLVFNPSTLHRLVARVDRRLHHGQRSSS